MHRSIFLSIALAVTVSTVHAKTWEERAAERFKRGISDQQRQLIAEALPEKPTVSPQKPRRILVISRCEGFIHTSIPFGKLMLEQMGKKSGAFTADFNDSYESFTPEDLAKYDAILFNNTTNLKPNDEQKAAILDFINRHNPE